MNLMLRFKNMHLFCLLFVHFIANVIASGQCPQICVCKWKAGKETSSCIGKNLKSIPSLEKTTQILDLTNNNLEILPNEAFKRENLLNLQKIYLRDCHLQHIDEFAFDGLTNLVELDISMNNLNFVPTKPLSALSFLRDLNMAGNSFQILESGGFVALPQLIKLDLSNCSIQSISGYAFKGLEQNLHILKLNDNQITVLQANTLKNLRSLKQLEIFGNPFNCGCQMRATKIWLDEQKFSFTITPICADGPERVLQRSFSELSVDEFACKPNILMQSTRYVEVPLGQNATIECISNSQPSPTISWYNNGKKIYNNTPFQHSIFEHTYIYEYGVFEKRSQLSLIVGQTPYKSGQEVETSFYCIAENSAGAAEANFSVYITKAIGIRNLDDTHITRLSAVLGILILFILLVSFILIVRLKRSSGTDSKISGGHMEIVHSVVAPELVVNKRELSLALPDSRGFQKNSQELQPPQQNYESGNDDSPNSNNPDLINDTREDFWDSRTYAQNYEKEQNSSILKRQQDAVRHLFPPMNYNSTSSNQTDYPADYGLPTTGQGAESRSYFASKSPYGTMAPDNGSTTTTTKTLRVWQKCGVPVLPPSTVELSKLKRALSSIRGSPDEGFQEGCATDV